VTSFDIFRSAGGANSALVEQFTSTANPSGTITIRLDAFVNNASIAGISISPVSGTPTPAPSPRGGGVDVKVAAALAALPSATPPPAASNTYYVNKSGSDRNDGLTSGTAFLTISKATSTMGSGDVAVVGPGTYAEHVCMTTAGTPSHYTTLIAQAGSARPLVTATANGCDISSILMAAPYTRVSGFAVNSQGVYNCIALYTDGTVTPTLAHHLMVDNNIAYNCGGYGVFTSGVDYVTITGNITYNDAFADPGQDSGISVGFPSAYDSVAGYHNYITDNISFGNFDKADLPGQNYTTDGEGILCDSLNLNGYSGKTLIAGNLVFANGGRGIGAYNSNNVDMINNTAFGDFLDTTQTDGGEIGVNGGTNNRFINNVAQAVDSSHNAYYQIAGASSTWTNNIAYIGRTYSNGTAINPATNKLGVNPLFLNASTNPSIADFNVQSGSPAIGYGAANAFTYTNLDGVVVPSGSIHNAGAY